MGFFKTKPKERHLKIVLAGGFKVGKTVTMLGLGKSPILGPVCLFDTQQGAQFYDNLISPPSEIVPVDTPEEMAVVVDQLVKGKARLPFKSLVVDDVATLWAKMIGVYDEYKALKYSGGRDLVAQKLFEEKMKNVGDWGKIKGQYHRILRSLFDLPVHVFLTTWITSVFIKDAKGNLVPTDDLTAKLEKATNYMVDAALQVKTDSPEGVWPKRLKIQYSRTSSVKDGDPLSVETFEKMAAALKYEPEPINNAAEVTKSLEASEVASEPEGSPVCGECKLPITKAIAMATYKQTGGRTLCLSCLKKK